MEPCRRTSIQASCHPALAVLGALVLGSCGPEPPVSTPGSDARTSASEVDRFCAACHRLPPPESLPRDRWRERIQVMFDIAGSDAAKVAAGLPPFASCVERYEARAPESLPPIPHTAGKGAGSLRLARSSYRLENVRPFPGVAHVSLVRLFDDAHAEILVSEMRFGMVFVIQPAFPERRKRLLIHIPQQFHPCHAEVVDLDRDGLRDVVVANLGTVTPSDLTCGSVLWLRRRAGDRFDPVTLAEGLGRVADVQAADFDGDGDVDLVAAVFGWRKVGSVTLLINETKDWAAPRFEAVAVDPRPGAIHVPITDLDRDGLPDFVALISQQFETVVAFLNRGSARFETREVYTAPHPNWGSTGIQLVDMDGDGDVDVLYANGDSLDDRVIKPYHGLQWLENRGSFPFTAHRLTDLYGASGAKAADLDGDGDMDVAASVFLPFIRPDSPDADLMESIVWLEQASPGVFERHSLGVTDCHYPTLELGDVDGDGDADILLGSMTMAKRSEDSIEDWVTVLKNLAR